MHTATLPAHTTLMYTNRWIFCVIIGHCVAVCAATGHTQPLGVTTAL